MYFIIIDSKIKFSSLVYISVIDHKFKKKASGLGKTIEENVLLRAMYFQRHDIYFIFFFPFHFCILVGFARSLVNIIIIEEKKRKETYLV